MFHSTTRVEEIETIGDDLSDDQDLRKQQRLNEQVVEPPSLLKVLIQELSSARQALLAQQEQALARLEKTCIESVGKAEATMMKLRREKGELEEELQKCRMRSFNPWASIRPSSQGSELVPRPVSTIALPNDEAPVMVGLTFSTVNSETSEEVRTRRQTSRQISRQLSRHNQQSNRPASRQPGNTARKFSTATNFSEMLDGPKISAENLARGVRSPKSKRRQSRRVFVDAASMKEKVKAAVMKREYNVFDYYHSQGIFQHIAKNPIFDTLTLVLVFANTLWIWIDTDYNTSEVLLKAHPIFLVVENLFCTFFTVELLIRFMAFARKRDCLRDVWFTFDTVLVVMMIVETWGMMLVAVLWPGWSETQNTGTTQFQVVRLVRILRITKMARMVRLLRAIPELMVLVKSVTVATRSVFFTLCLLVIVIYLFAFIFVQLERSDLLGDAYSEQFLKVPDAMLFLLLRGILPDQAEDVYAFSVSSPLASVVFMVFILVATLTVMNMLVGVLVQIIGAVSDVEREQMAVRWVKAKLLEMLESTGLDEDGNMEISKNEFQTLLLNPKAAKMVHDLGVDVVGLVDFAELIFENDRELTFPEFMDWVLQLRGSNTATVKDIVDLRKFVSLELQEAVQTVLKSVTQDSVTEIKKEVRRALSNELVFSTNSFKGMTMSLEEV